MPPVNVYAASKGEIININHQFQIAFTDLTSQTLSVGDVVDIVNGGSVVAQLGVLESSDVLSKLGPLTGSEVDFRKISIGFEVKKSGKAQLKPSANTIEAVEVKSVRTEGTKDIGSTTKVLQNTVAELTKNYAQVTNELRSTKQENEKLFQELDQSRRDLKQAQARVVELEQFNKDFRVSQDRVTAEKNKLQDELAKTKQLNDKYKSKLEVLKQRLQKMSKIAQ